MTLDEAMPQTVWGCRFTAAHLPDGVCLVYDSKYEWRRFRREWPNGDGCEFIATDEDRAADWYEVEREPEPAPAPLGFVPGPGVKVHTAEAVLDDMNAMRAGEGWYKAAPDLPPGTYYVTLGDDGRPDMVKPVPPGADRWANGAEHNIHVPQTAVMPSRRWGKTAAAEAWGRPNDPAYVAAVDKLIGEPAKAVSGWGKPPAVERDKWGKPA